MKTLTISFLVCLICSMAQADSLTFLQSSLDVNIHPKLFGRPLAQFEVLKPAGAFHTNGRSVDLSKYEWYQTRETASYDAKHPGRFLLYGFKDGELSAIHIRIWGLDQDAIKAEEARKTIREAFAQFKSLSSGRTSFEDKSLRIVFTPFCSSAEDLFAVLVLTPPRKG